MLRRLAILSAALALTLAACATSSDSDIDQQQRQAFAAETAQQVQQPEQQDSAFQSDSGQDSQAASTTVVSRRVVTISPSTAESQAREESAEEQSDAGDGMGGMEPGMAVGIIEAADYDDLSPRLQLLRDSGYPVYVADSGYTISLGTPDLSPGEHRLSVVIEGPVGLVEFPAIAVTVVPQDAPGEMQEVIARFARFPDGIRGFHVTEVDFTHTGRWNLILHVPSEDGFTDLGIALDVPDDTAAPSVGDAAPASDSRTLTDVANIADLSTGETPDPGLYLISIADAVADAKPFVVVFASPGFCTNAFCGPQAEVLSEVRALYGDAANYVHVDLYENPEQVRYGEEPIETPILEEWGLHTDEWTFVVNADGVVTHRFEAFAPLAEVEAALASVLEG